MKRFLIIFLLSLAPTAQAAWCGPAEGTWVYQPNRQQFVLEPNGRADLWNIGVPGGATGYWQCTAYNQINIQWNTGYVDTLTFQGPYQLSGYNNAGQGLYASRR